MTVTLFSGRRAAQYPARHARLLAEAASQFATAGYHATRMDQIGTAVGAPRAPRHYFTDKQTLLASIIHGHAECLSASQLAVLDHPAPTPRQQLAALANAYATTARAAAPAHLVLLREWRHLSAESQADLRARRRWLLQPLADALVAALPRGRAASPPAALGAARSLLAVLDAQVQWLHPDGALPPERGVAAAVAMALAGLSVLAGKEG